MTRAVRNAVLTTTLSIAVTVGAQEGISLLQTQAHLHMQQPAHATGKGDGINGPQIRGRHVQGLTEGLPFRTADLPDPKKQVTVEKSTAYDMLTKPTPFECKNGKGKWVWMNTGPDTPEGGAPAKGSTHLQTTLDIQHIHKNEVANSLLLEDNRPTYEFHHWNYKDLREKPIDDPKTPAFSKPTYTDHGEVTNEKDCYARAIADQSCMHWLEAVHYATQWKDGVLERQAPKTIGVFYKHNYEGSASEVYSDCMCGQLARTKYLDGRKPPLENVIVAGDTEREGAWFCQLLGQDLPAISHGLEESTDWSSEASDEKAPKEKKSKEEKEQCKKNKAAAKASKAALKELRKQLKAARAAVKDLKAQIKAAKEDFKTKKEAKC